MSMVRPTNYFLSIICGTIKDFRLAAMNTLIILIAVTLLSGAREFAATHQGTSRDQPASRVGDFSRRQDVEHERGHR